MKHHSVNVVFAAGKDAYHLQRARECFDEADYFDAIAQTVREDHPHLTYREALRDAIAIDAYSRDVLEGRGIGKRARARLQAQSHVGGVHEIEA